MLLNNSFLNGVLSLSIVKDSTFNEETRRKDTSIDNAQDFSMRTMVEVKSRKGNDCVKFN